GLRRCGYYRRASSPLGFGGARQQRARSAPVPGGGDQSGRHDDDTSMNEATPERQDAAPKSGLARWREQLRLLYHGHSDRDLRFQRAVLLVDLAIIAFFIATPLLRGRPSFLWIDLAVAA